MYSHVIYLLVFFKFLYKLVKNSVKLMFHFFLLSEGLHHHHWGQSAEGFANRRDCFADREQCYGHRVPCYRAGGNQRPNLSTQHRDWQTNQHLASKTHRKSSDGSPAQLLEGSTGAVRFEIRRIV